MFHFCIIGWKWDKQEQPLFKYLYIIYLHVLNTKKIILINGKQNFSYTYIFGYKKIIFKISFYSW